MLLEYEIQQENWSAFLPLIQANLILSPVVLLANHAAAEVFLGVVATTPLQKLLKGSEAVVENIVAVNDGVHDVQAAVDCLRASIEDMHHDIESAKEKQTKRNKNNQRGAKPVNFHVGDYVLWSRVQAKTRVNKLSVKWVGPYRV
ncbi:hypothetical protein PI124_g15330 [Phytophthora idaei]|nr:hypothetical protein PI125_g17268 [Phytophthora idaei]KAG3140703.1 hypothetical protein PI126_g15859 [Phytophthora idaei]KAG3239743.1 hypothetical protein PI124_g15330 [Phytophthora idaei]